MAAADFFDTRNRHAFEAIAEIVARGDVPDVTLVVSALKERRRAWEDAGGYLGRCMDNCSVPSVVSYATIVQRKSRQRQALVLSQTLAAQARDDVGDLDEWAAQAAKDFDAIATGSATVVDYEWVGETLKRVERERLDAHREGRRPQRIPTGLVGLDKLLTMRPKELVVVGALPSMGKTALVGQILNHVSNQDAWEPEERMAFPGEVPHTMLVALEMTRERMSQRLLCGRAMVTKGGYETMRLTSEEQTRLEGAAQTLSIAPMAIMDRPNTKLIDVVRNFRAFARESARTKYFDRPKAKGRVRVLVTDYLTLLRTERTKGGTTSEVVGEVVMDLKNFAKSEDILVILVSQLSREVTKRPGDKRPMMSDLRDSGEIEQAADTIVFIHRDEVLNRASPWRGFGEVIVAKQREGEIGRVFLRWEGAQTRFADLGYEDVLAIQAIKDAEQRRREGRQRG